MKIRILPTTLVAAAVLAFVPTAHAEPDFLRMYERTGTVTEANPLGVPEFEDLADLGNWPRNSYAEYMGTWWEYRDYLKPNCARHVTSTDAALWYSDPANVEEVDKPRGENSPWYIGVDVVNHYPGKTAAQCATENGTPPVSTPGGSISGSLTSIGL
ncbi:hypothetical protein [Corynebacterium glyciniphilum]|uniref:hypothetical protein n=1 Tax=Corynebacterium glyciniphilum TaxID=1404244 RepID=UPI0011AB657C|nr:hypothetical protein [Corynebacterium glyciniphilum]